MTEEDEQNNTVLRARRRNSANGSHTANGHAQKDESKSWNWTRSKDENPFARDNEGDRRQPDDFDTEEIPMRRRLGFDSQSPRFPKTPPDAIKFPFDPWRLLSAVKRRWSWLIIGAVAMGAIAYFVGDRMAKYRVSVNLIRRQVDSAINSNQQDPNRPRELSEQTIFAFMRSGDVLRSVSERAATNTPPIVLTPQTLAESVSVTPTAIPDILVLSVAGRSNDPNLATLANLYAEEVVRYTRDIQASESGDVATYLAQKIQLADKELARANEDFLKFQEAEGLTTAPDKESENYGRQISEYTTKYNIAQVERETYARQIAGLSKELVNVNPSNDKIKSAQEELDVLLSKYTEIHPEVISQKAKIEALKKTDKDPKTSPGLQTGSSSFANSMYLQKLELTAKMEAADAQMTNYTRLKEEAKEKLPGLSQKGIRYAELQSQIKALEATRQLLVVKQRDSKLFVDNAMGYYRVYGQARPQDINWKNRWMKISILTSIGILSGLLGAILLAFVVEAFDSTLKTASDIERATGLPILARLGDLKTMNPDQRLLWSFNTLTDLIGSLCRDPDDTLVCGIISSTHGEGRSVWAELLSHAGARRGFQSAWVRTRGQYSMAKAGADEETDSTLHQNGAPSNFTEKKSAKTQSPPPAESVTPVDAGAEKPAAPIKSVILARDYRSFSLEAVQQAPRMHTIDVHLPGDFWNIQGRSDWQETIREWQKVPGHAIFIELPPATEPEAILLASKMPNVIWLTGSGKADVAQTKEQLARLRKAKCQLVGAVINMEPKAAIKHPFMNWFKRGAAAWILGLILHGSVQGQEKLSFSATASAQPKRAAWQQRLTLGPGDSMDISLFGQPTLSRTNIFVGPDGRISYLQAQGIIAKGLTIEELRAKLDQELARYHNNARTIVIPTAFVSKKYYVLGKVVNKGVYSLDRPLTIVEAVARAQGLETGLYERNSIEMADLSRSFLIRNGSREKIDLEKLFLDGDLAQNIALEPDDFLFFAGAGAKEIYVLGEVNNPGPIGFVPNATLLSAITDRSGFSSRAYKSKILVVRGSLNKPETFVVDASAILDAKAPDFKLQSKDIIYVGHRPWIRAEELLDDALQSFIQGFVTAFTGAKMGPYLNPIFGN